MQNGNEKVSSSANEASELEGKKRKIEPATDAKAPEIIAQQSTAKVEEKENAVNDANQV